MASGELAAVPLEQQEAGKDSMVRSMRTRHRTAWLLVGLLCACGLADTSLGQIRGGRGGGRPMPMPQPQPQPMPPPVVKPYRGPGYLARPSFAGIGRVKADVDLLSSPASRRFAGTPIPVTPVTAVVGGRPVIDDRMRAAAWYNRQRERRYPYPYLGDRFYGGSSVYYPYTDVITAGTGLAVGSGYGYGGYTNYGYGYAPAYPSNTVGVMELPAPAIRYDAATGTYVYGYGNPAGPPLVSANGPQTHAAPVHEEVTTTAPPTALQLAMYNLQLDQPGLAVNGLREHLKQNEDDAFAQRVLGVALLREKRFDDGVASIRQAYRLDPKLADEPMNGPELGLSDAELRGLVLRAVTYAHRVDTGSAWLTVAALMQAEGRQDTARQMLDRAIEKGLDTTISGPMSAALEPKKD